MQLLIQHNQDKVIWFTVSSGWGPISTLHSLIQTKEKKSCFDLLCPQLLLVNRSAVSFLEDDLPQNQGGAAVERGGGCCKHNSQSSREIWLHQQAKGVRQGNLGLTWLHKWLQTWSNQLTVFVPFFSKLVHTSVAYVSHYVTPEKKKEIRLFFLLATTQVENK